MRFGGILFWRAGLAAIAFAAADIAIAAGYGFWAEAQAQRAGPENASSAIAFYADDIAGDKARLVKAMSLWRNGMVENLYFVGGARADGSGAARQAAAAIAAGAPAERVGSDLSSFDTETNVASACAAIMQRQWRRVALVSDAMHIVRIRYLLRRSPCKTTATVAAPTPGPDFGETWGRAHYEAIAWIVDVLLPRQVRMWVLHRLRPQRTEG